VKTWHWQAISIPRCNLCVSICPVPGALTMRTLKPGEMDARTGHPVAGHYANWTTHPNNPLRVAERSPH